MIKIITAIGKPELNYTLKKINDFDVLDNDIFYKEGILEFLEKNKNIDILILYEKLSGEINIINLIKKIKIINNKINIFFIFENKNEELENLLKKENIENIFFNNKINLKEFIEKLKEVNNNKNLENEVEMLKKIIKEQNEKILMYKGNNEPNFKDKKTVAIIGNKAVGKTLILNNFKCVLEEKKVVAIDLRKKNYENFFNNQIKNFDICFLEIDFENWKIIKNNNVDFFIFIIENNLISIKKDLRKFNNFILQNKINYKKINIIFNKVNKYSINNKIIKNIFNKYKIVGNIKLNNFENISENKINNYEIENKILIKKYKKIIKKINKKNK
mgnify:CR=1 FL=1